MGIFTEPHTVTPVICKRCGTVISDVLIDDRRVQICKSCIEFAVEEIKAITKEFATIEAKINQLQVTIDTLIKENNELRKRLSELDKEKTQVTNELPEM